MNTSSTSVGRTFVAVAGVWIGYLIVAFTLANSYEQALADAAEKLGVEDNKLPADVVARINDEHTVASLVGLPLLLAAPAVLLLAVVGVRRRWPSSLADWAVRSAGVSGGIWWSYQLIALGAYGNSGSLPPLTRNLDDLTVPLVAASSAFAVLAVIGATEALRRVGCIRRSAIVANVVAGLLLVAGVADTVLSGLDRPLPPIALVPPALIVGIALLRSARKPSPIASIGPILAPSREE